MSTQSRSGANSLVTAAEIAKLANEVLVWQALRAQYGNDTIRGLADVAELSCHRLLRRR